jgi:hypothetical protein
MRRDLNDAIIVEAVRRAGFEIIDFTKAGVKGIPDHLAIRPYPDGVYFSCWLEVKSQKGKLSEEQKKIKRIFEPRMEWIEARNPEETVKRLWEFYMSKIKQEHLR